jgi:hypothetical protein
MASSTNCIGRRFRRVKFSCAEVIVLPMRVAKFQYAFTRSPKQVVLTEKFLLLDGLEVWLGFESIENFAPTTKPANGPPIISVGCFTLISVWPSQVR